jgi:hypothetical protein
MKLLFTPVFLCLMLRLTAQSTIYKDDLVALNNIVQSLPSFKAQIKGKQLLAYQALYQTLAKDTLTNPNSFQYFYNLSRLIMPLRDNHIGFYQLPKYQYYKTKERLDSFLASKAFLDYPTDPIAIDSLTKALSQSSPDSIEGIYHYDSAYQVGLFKKQPGEYVGVIISSKTNLWATGQVAIRLYQTGPNLYKAIYSHPLFKHYNLQTIEKFQNQSLVNSFFYASFSKAIYTKRVNQVDYVNLPKTNVKFNFKQLNPTVQYVMIQSFQANDQTKKASKAFYDSVKAQLNAPVTVLDLRNNEGGSKTEMMQYYRLFKQYIKNGRLFVLMNNGTLSQGELFILRLRKLKQVIVLGQTSKGMLTYGSNYDKRITLPSGQIEIYPTDMRGNSRRLQYEDIGIQPDVYLHYTTDWIEQTLSYIQTIR